MADEPVHDLDRLLRVVDRDVDVHAEDQLAARDVLKLVDERAVAVLRRDALPLEERERMRAGRADAQAAVRARPRRRSRAGAAAARRRRRPCGRRRRDLEHRLHQLGVDPRLERCPATPATTVSMCWTRSKVLPSRSMNSSTTPSVNGRRAPDAGPGAAAIGVAAALAGDRRRKDRLPGALRRPRILESQRRVEQADDHAGRRGPRLANASPWARRTSGPRPAWVMRSARANDVLGPPHASRSAATTISRQRRAWPYGSAGGSASSGMIGAVPATKTRSPTTTARL